MTPVPARIAPLETHPDFSIRSRQVEDARNTLKKEFIGIDHIIDRILDAVLPWLVLPQINGRPTIINLWGLTGVGKSSVVNRLAELLGFTDRYFRFDLGELSGRERGIHRKLSELFPHHNGQNMILAFDEFQHARTIGQDSEELDKSHIRTIWDILDSGRFTTEYNSHSQSTVFQLMHTLSAMVTAGVTIENGKVVDGIDIYRSIHKSNRGMFDSDTDSENERDKPAKHIQVVPQWQLDDVLDVCLGRFKTMHELNQHLLQLNGPEIVSFLSDIYLKSLAPQQVDCSRSLIFVMGNLDEAYPMSHNLNPDISADEFHRQSLQINISHIRRALSSRFRMEQIGRLGNCHIIYPAINQNTYERIIRLELGKISSKTSSYGVRLTFDRSVESLLYREGVIPTQGIRPVLTTIQEMIGGQAARIVMEKIRLGLQEIDVELSVEKEKLIRRYLHEGIPLLIQEELLPLFQDKIRQPRRDDLQAITAVHESGHAILSMALRGIVPESVFSITAQESAAGFMYTSEHRHYYIRKEIPALLAVLLGGLAAEQLIFGEENTTTGSDSDLKAATRLANGIIQESGLAGEPGVYGNPTKSELTTLPNQERHHQLAESWLREAFRMATETLNKEMSLLVKMADYLSDHTVLHRTEIIQFAKDYGKEIAVKETSAEESDRPFRRRVKELASTSWLRRAGFDELASMSWLRQAQPAEG